MLVSTSFVSTNSASSRQGGGRRGEARRQTACVHIQVFFGGGEEGGRGWEVFGLDLRSVHAPESGRSLSIAFTNVLWGRLKREGYK